MLEYVPLILALAISTMVVLKNTYVTLIVILLAVIAAAGFLFYAALMEVSKRER